MTLAAVVDAVVARAGAALGPAASVSDRAPVVDGELPHVTVSVTGADRPHIGIGGIPQAPEQGALPLTVRIDLADPTLTVGGETIRLVDFARTTVVVPNGPLVKADGTDDTPFGVADLAAADPSGPYAVVAGAPNGRQFRVDVVDGTLRFGQALPAAGTLVLSVHIGVWDVVVVRFTGALHLDVTTGAGAIASTLARQVAAAVDDLGGPFQRLVPSAWGPAERGAVGDSATLRRRLTYDFAFELRSSLVGTSGGVIRAVDVTAIRDAPSLPDTTTERFRIPAPVAP